MKAYILSEPGKRPGAWELANRPDPVPGPTEAVIAIRAVSLNYRDLMIARGQYFRGVRQGVIPASDGAGEVLAVGGMVSKVKPGDRVMNAFFPNWESGPIHPAAIRMNLGAANLDGMLAEKVAFPASALVRIPDYLSFEEAATLPCAAVTAWNALFETSPPLPPGSTVLTLGTGGVSIFAFQFSKAAGLRVIGTSGSDSKLERMRSLGFLHGINYHSNPEWQDEVQQLTNGGGVDHAIEVAGGTLPRTLRATRMGGIVSFIGGLTGFSEQVSLEALLGAGTRLQPIVVGSVAMFENMSRAMEAHQIRPIVDEIFPFDHANEALARLESGTHFGKIVIRV
ncbi:MAG: NAD(P)-dependent alcohol dehydrogenase [Acidobacteriia bacterium]|nr:NAD(P)-dependent alcohol dehydrogenase [Terriglobia bacterium]